MVGRIGGQNAFVSLDHALGLTEPVARNVRHAFEGLRAQPHVGSAFGQTREHVAQAIPRMARGIERFQRINVSGLRIGFAQGAQHARILGLGRVHPPQGVERSLSRAEFLDQDQPAPFEQGAALGAVFPARRFGQTNKDLGQRRPALFAFVEPRQRGHRNTVARHQFKHLVPQPDGLAQIRQPLGRQDGHFRQVRPPRLRAEKDQLAAQEIQQGPPRTPARVDFAQRGSRRSILRVEFEDLF